MSHADIIVLIPYYNNLDGLKKSLGSISALEPVDVLIVDDGSKIKPDSGFLKKSFPAIHDIIIVNLEKNMGIEHALNRGLQYIMEADKYPFVARLDCGDLCRPDRFKLQKQFLDENKEIYLVGSWVQWITPEGKPLYIYELPLQNEEIKSVMYYKDPFVHPAIMFRTEVLKKTGFYPTKYIYCEDTAFFFNILQYFKTANIPQPLVDCIIDPHGISQSKYRKQKLSRIRFSLNTFSFRYLFMWSFGLAKNVACYVLGNKIPTQIAILIEKKN